jgi:hypothetical protein
MPAFGRERANAAGLDKVTQTWRRFLAADGHVRTENQAIV